MTYEKMLEKINTAGAWFTGAFMGEILKKYPEYYNDTAKRVAFINYMHEEYGKTLEYSFDSTKTKCYAVMAIIKGERVLDAMDHVILTNDKKVTEDARENATYLLDAIIAGNIDLP